MVVATSHENVPWISPVFFVHDDNYNLYWVSYTEARHSQNVQANNQVAISIFNSQAPEGDGDGVYFECTAEALVDSGEIAKAIDLWNKKVTGEVFKINSQDEVTGSGAWRIYKATPKTISKLGKGTSVNGQYVDQRIELSLEDVMNINDGN